MSNVYAIVYVCSILFCRFTWKRTQLQQQQQQHAAWPQSHDSPRLFSLFVFSSFVVLYTVQFSTYKSFWFGSCGRRCADRRRQRNGNIKVTTTTIHIHDTFYKGPRWIRRLWWLWCHRNIYIWVECDRKFRSSFECVRVFVAVNRNRIRIVL